ncbi:hypothetical protein JD844_010353 [Phrynosoma platyrhinos]|uniref:Uncharacterized protein n=1 Tax=Phrynosoma platyrhinos TaxID=52577 RepID=A0ABQ7THB0_PHRPL|nr:hypothetical protein JD844_010353 [Phrynosoma platyrhinos]
MAQQEEDEEVTLGKMDSRDPLTKEIDLVERDPKQINQDVVKGHSDVTADLSHCFKEGIAEGTYAQGVATPAALDFNEVALDARHGPPDVAEGDAGKEEAPEQGKGHTQCP